MLVQRCILDERYGRVSSAGTYRTSCMFIDPLLRNENQLIIEKVEQIKYDQTRMNFQIPQLMMKWQLHSEKEY